MLKKQTIWLLTMLSLMIVLSVYYMLSDPDELAYIDDGTDSSQEAAKQDSTEEKEDDAQIDDVTNIGKDELFTTLRMNLEDERSMKKDRLKEIVASGNATIEEKNEAKNDIDNLDELSTKEAVLEESILATAQYEDVLVRSDEDKVHVHVKVDELSEEEAVHIMQMVRDEFGDVTVDVNYQPTEES
ncbi:MAG TPA: SpoIIIAH-like family protein [Bacillota bacterium]|nr:SpoIIIAH-like family protein [Bacillota bacterium]